MENGKVVETLKTLGFTASEISVYKVLVENDYLIVNEISKYSNVPRTKTYEVLNRLESKDIIQKLDVRPVKYRAKDPIKTLTKMRETLIEETKLGLELLEESWNQKEIIDESQSIMLYDGVSNFYKIFKRIEDDVKLDLFILVTFLGSQDHLFILKNIIKTNIRKGIKVELILHPNVEDKLDSATKKFFKQNSILQIVPVPLSLVIIDNKELVIQIPSSESKENLGLENIHNLIIRIPYLVQTIEKGIRGSINRVIVDYNLKS